MNHHKIKKIIIKNKNILIILAVALIFRLFFEFQHYELWWDEVTYIAIGKNIFSYGELGLWEPLRPLFLPVILGFFWKIGLPVILAGRILTLMSTLIVIYFIYILGKKVFNENTGVIASLFVSFINWSDFMIHGTSL